MLHGWFNAACVAIISARHVTSMVEGALDDAIQTKNYILCDSLKVAVPTLCSRPHYQTFIKIILPEEMHNLCYRIE